MKKLLGFIAGATFMAVLIITCGGNGKDPSHDAGSIPTAEDTGAPGSGSWDTKFSSTSADIGFTERDTGWLDSLTLPSLGVGDARGQTQPATRTLWEYWQFFYNEGSTIAPIFSGPNPALDFTSCKQGVVACVLNIAGGAGWELVATSVYKGGAEGIAIREAYTFKRPKQ